MEIDFKTIAEEIGAVLVDELGVNDATLLSESSLESESLSIDEMRGLISEFIALISPEQTDNISPEQDKNWLDAAKNMFAEHNISINNVNLDSAAEFLQYLQDYANKCAARDSMADIVEKNSFSIS